MIAKNNVFNIRNCIAAWKGQTGVSHGFVCFEDVKFAVRAWLILLRNTYPRYKCKTLKQVVYRYCPFGDGANNPDAYLDYLYNHGFSCNDIVTSFTKQVMFELAFWFAKIETGVNLDKFDFNAGLKLYLRDYEW